MEGRWGMEQLLEGRDHGERVEEDAEGWVEGKGRGLRLDWELVVR